MQLYTKNESGEFSPATQSQLDEVFREKSDPIVARRIASIRDKELEKVRPEFEKKIREELEPTLKKEAEAVFSEKLTAANQTINDLNVKLNRKTIAAEYGFKSDLEEFLGNGTEEEMRAKADALKNNLGTAPDAGTFPNKGDGSAPSEAEEKYGLKIEI